MLDVRHAVADEQGHPAEQVGPQLEVQRALQRQPLEVARLGQHDRAVVLEVAVELDDLRDAGRGRGQLAHVRTLVYARPVGLVGQLQVAVVVGGVDDGEAEPDDEPVDGGLAHLVGRVPVPRDVHPAPQRAERPGLEGVVFGQRLVVAEPGELVRVEAEPLGDVGRQLPPRRRAEVHRHARPDEQQGVAVADGVDEFLHGRPPDSSRDRPRPEGTKQITCRRPGRAPGPKVTIVEPPGRPKPCTSATKVTNRGPSSREGVIIISCPLSLACPCRSSPSGPPRRRRPPRPARDAGPRLGRRRCRLRHRRRLRRSPQLRHGDPAPRAGGGRLPRRHPEPARLAHRASRGGSSAGRGCSSPSAPATWTRSSTTTPPTRRSATTTPTRPAAASACGPTGPRCRTATARREAFPGVPVIAGGVEASLRRLAHYDYWSDTVRRSILLDCKADLVVYGMGETTIVEIARRLAAGQDGARPARPARRGLRPGGKRIGELRPAASRSERAELGRARRARPTTSIVLPSFEAGERRQAGVRRGDAAHPHQHQPVQRQRRWCSSTTARRSSSTRRPCRCRRRRWTASTTCRTRAGRTRPTPSRSRPTR